MGIEPWPNNMGLKMKVIENIGEHFGNMMGTFGELDGNTFGTNFENFPLPLPPTLEIEEKKLSPSKLSKTIHHHFQLRLNTPIINWGYLLNFFLISHFSPRNYKKNCLFPFKCLNLNFISS
jgi:hypothetical protein